MFRTPLAFMVVLSVQVLITGTSITGAEQDTCPYLWCEQPSNQAWICDPQGAVIRMKCSVFSLETNVSVSWFMTNNTNDAGRHGNQLTTDERFEVSPLLTDVNNVSFISVFFTGEECNFGYYWCEVTGPSLNMASSFIVSIFSNNSLPSCETLGIPYDPPSNKSKVCAVEGFGLSNSSSFIFSTTFYSTSSTESSYSSYSTSSTEYSYSKITVVTSSLLDVTSSLEHMSSVSAIAQTINPDQSQNIIPSINTIMTSQYLLTASVSNTPKPNAAAPISLIIIVAGICTPLVLAMLVTVTVVCCVCHQKKWYKKSSVTSSETCLAARNVSISHSLEQMTSLDNSQTEGKTQCTLEKKHLSKSLDLSLLPESHVYVNSAMIHQKTPTNSIEGYADPKQLSDSVSSIQHEQNCTLRRQHSSNSPRSKRSQSLKSERGFVFATPTTVSCIKKPDPVYDDPKKLLSSSIPASNSQQTTLKAQKQGESSSGYAIPFECVPASAKQKANTLTHATTRNASSPVQYNHLKPLSGREFNTKDGKSSGCMSKTTSEEPGYAVPWDIKGGFPTGVKHGALRPTSRAATTLPPRRSNTLPQLGLVNLALSPESVGKQLQSSECRKSSLHSLTSSQHTIGNQRTGPSSASVSSLDNHYDEPWDLKNIPTGVRVVPAKKRSATLRPRPKPNMIESLDDDSRN